MERGICPTGTWSVCLNESAHILLLEMPSHHFLYFYFLKRAKAAGSCLHMKGTTNSILPTLVYVLAVKNGHESFVGYILESFGTANIACIGIDL